jgi:hypothetical protein
VSELAEDIAGAENLQWSAEPSAKPQSFSSLLKKVGVVYGHQLNIHNNQLIIQNIKLLIRNDHIMTATVSC